VSPDDRIVQLPKDTNFESPKRQAGRGGLKIGTLCPMILVELCYYRIVQTYNKGTFYIILAKKEILCKVRGLRCVYCADFASCVVSLSTAVQKIVIVQNNNVSGLSGLHIGCPDVISLGHTGASITVGLGVILELHVSVRIILKGSCVGPHVPGVNEQTELATDTRKYM
jgi:hypothetical protein